MARYLVTVEGREYDIELESHGEHFIARLGNREVEVFNSPLGGTRSMMLIDSVPTEVDIEGNGYVSQRSILMKGIEVAADIEDYNLAQLRRTAGMSGSAAIEKIIRAPMPGLVLDVKVKVGDTVKKNQAIIVIEAMKMENLIKAPGDGTVKAVHVSANNSVEKSDKLLELE